MAPRNVTVDLNIDAAGLEEALRRFSETMAGMNQRMTVPWTNESRIIWPPEEDPDEDDDDEEECYCDECLLERSQMNPSDDDNWMAE